MEKEIIGLIVNDDREESERIYKACHRFNIPILPDHPHEGLVDHCFFRFNEDGLILMNAKKMNELKTILYGTNAFYDYLDKKSWANFADKLCTYSSHCILAGGFSNLTSKTKADFPDWVVDCYEHGLTAKETFDLCL